VTRKIDLPDEDRVLEALTTLRDTGRRPTAAALAREVGLSNTTFWRHFRDIALELQAPPPQSSTRDTTAPASRDHEAKLRRERDELAAQLGTALGHLRRLTIENTQLRLELDDANNVTRISTRSRADSAAR
jgi:AcrR family transcriptional regulator